MNRVIYKYLLTPTAERQILSLPRGATFICFAIQYESLFTLWFLVDPSESRTTDRTFKIVGTGHSFPASNLHHLATAMTADTAYVWHLFEERVEVGLADLEKDKDAYYTTPPAEEMVRTEPDPWSSEDSVKGIAEQEREYRGMV